MTVLIGTPWWLFAPSEERQRAVRASTVRL